jgi:catechol 2,3-dioxygenase-like lactoylglutathione lyase family enzyme
MLGSSPVTPVVACSDIERSKAFYRDLLGFSIEVETEAGAMFRAGEGTRFFVYPSAGAGTDRSTHLSFTVPDIVAAVAALRGKGVVFEEYDFPGLKTVDGIAEIPGEGRGAWFKDPDGTILAIDEGDMTSG